MPTNRKLLGAAAFSLALAGGGVAGALLGTPNLSGAQDGTDEHDRRPRHRADAGRPVPGHRGERAGRRRRGHRHHARTSCARPSRTASRSPRSPRRRASTCRP